MTLFFYNFFNRNFPLFSFNRLRLFLFLFFSIDLSITFGSIDWANHYAKTVLEFIQAENVPFVPKSLNPANVPKVRPIEDFWAILKHKVYENDWSAENNG